MARGEMQGDDGISFTWREKRTTDYLTVVFKLPPNDSGERLYGDITHERVEAIA